MHIPDGFLSVIVSILLWAVSIAVIAFIAVRLRDSRLGRAWVAIREDEDVAEALGINLVQTKSLAYMLGAAFAGLGGAIFVVGGSPLITDNVFSANLGTRGGAINDLMTCDAQPRSSRWSRR